MRQHAAGNGELQDSGKGALADVGAGDAHPVRGDMPTVVAAIAPKERVPVPPPLTAKQSAFADGLMAGLTQHEAYRQAFDAAGMSDHAIANEASLLAKRPEIAGRLQARRDAASRAVDEAVIAARLGAGANLARLDAIAALPVGGEADPRTLPATRGAVETLLGIAEVIPRAAGATVDARSVTLNVGTSDPRMVGMTVDELTTIIRGLREAGPAHDGPAGEESAPDS